MIPKINTTQTTNTGMSESGSGDPNSGSCATDKTVWECDDCGAVYDSRDGLKYHFQTDGNDCSGIECPECGKAVYYNRRGLKLHLAREHDVSGSYLDDRLESREWYYQKYVVEGYSSHDIADLVGCSDAQARVWKDRHNIPTITQYKSRGEGFDNPNADSESTVRLDCDYCGDEMVVSRSRHERGEHTFCSRDCCDNHKSEYWIGDNNPLYKGGPINYGQGWHRAREERLEHDSHTCQDCGSDSDLEVHHIRPVRQFDNPSDAHYLDNLITLCKDCHPKWEGIPLKPDNR